MEVQRISSLLPTLSSKQGRRAKISVWRNYASILIYRDDKVLAVCSLAMDPVVSTSAELMFQGKMPMASQLR